MNAVTNGLNVAELQVQVSLGESPVTRHGAEQGRLSHNSVQALLGAAIVGRTRRAVMREAVRLLLHRGP